MAPLELPFVLQIIPYMLILVVFGSYAGTILNERPTRSNAERMARRVAGRARRRNADALVAVARKRRAVRPAAITLAAFAAIAVVLALGITLTDARDYGGAFVSLALPRDLLLLATAGGLLPVAAAYYYWAPRLLDEVRAVLEAEAATTKEPPTMPSVET